jgi:hypothetical protein
VEPPVEIFKYDSVIAFEELVFTTKSKRAIYKKEEIL